jgi:hypothetical protein
MATPKTPPKVEDDAATAPMLAEGESVSAPTLALLIADPIGTHRWALAKSVNDKRVRQTARETVARYIERDGRTIHAYTEGEADAIVARLRGGTTGGLTAATLRERVK